MKKIIFALIILLSIPKVNALSIEEKILRDGYYINSESVTIDLENYNKIKDKMSEIEIENMTSRTYEIIEDSIELAAYEEAVFETKYTTIAGDVFILEENELSLEEYENLSQNPQPASISYETTYKYLKIFATKEGTQKYQISVQNNWKKIPANKSFDVIAVRWGSGVVNLGTDYSGVQDYKITPTEVNPDSVDYIQGETPNFKTSSNGLGLSQNLVNGEYYYTNVLTAMITCSGTVDLYGAYQHAQGDVTLAQSQQYIFSSSGYGKVILFNTTTLANTYDGMSGVNTTITCS